MKAHELRMKKSGTSVHAPTRCNMMISIHILIYAKGMPLSHGAGDLHSLLKRSSCEYGSEQTSWSVRMSSASIAQKTNPIDQKDFTWIKFRRNTWCIDSLSHLLSDNRLGNTIAVISPAPSSLLICDRAAFEFVHFQSWYSHLLFYTSTFDQYDSWVSAHARIGSKMRWQPIW